jgi:hypothetical protein
MADVVIVLTILAVISLCVAYVEWCDRIIRRDEPATTSDPSAEREQAGVAS